MVIKGLAPAGLEACSTAWMSLEKPAPAGQRAVAAAPRRRKERTPNRKNRALNPWRAWSRMFSKMDYGLTAGLVLANVAWGLVLLLAL
jgi:hypothetical protein